MNSRTVTGMDSKKTKYSLAVHGIGSYGDPWSTTFWMDAVHKNDPSRS